MTTPLRVRGACPHDCPDTCGVVTEVEDGRAVRFVGDPDHPVTRGWLCAKVRPYLDHVYHPGRVLYPLRRVGPKGGGQWRRISWDEAIDEIARRWKEIIAHFGAEAILPYSYSGTLGLVQMGVSSARFWNRLGASQLERSICGAAAELAVETTLGKRWSPPYADAAHSKLVVLWGHNPVASAPHFLPFLKQGSGPAVNSLSSIRGGRRRRGADLHLAPRPGTDGALALGLAHVLVAEGRHDEAWLSAHAIGWPELRERLAGFPPDYVAAITGLEKEEIIALARRYAERRPGLIKIADGINRNLNGGQNVRAICALPALTGQYGVCGGGLAYSTSGYLQWDRRRRPPLGGLPAARPRRQHEPPRRRPARRGGRAADPALYVFGANPAASSPNAGRIVEGLRRDDLFTVVHELFLTDTADYADLVLPATSQLEHVDLHKAYGHTFVTYNRPAIAPLGECKSNWEATGLLATALGFHEPHLHQTADDVIDEVVKATARHNPFLRGVTPERLRAEGAVPLAVEGTPFADGRFPTPSGKVELHSKRMAQMGYDPLPSGAWDADDSGPIAPRWPATRGASRPPWTPPWCC